MASVGALVSSTGQLSAVAAPRANQRLTLQGLPPDAIGLIMQQIPARDTARAKATSKFFRDSIDTTIAIELNIASSQLDARIQAFRKAVTGELDQTRKTWCGWLVHKLNPREGVIGKIAAYVHRLFSFFSASFRLESYKQNLMTEWSMRDLRKPDKLDAQGWPVAGSFPPFYLPDEIFGSSRYVKIESFAWGKMLRDSVDEIRELKRKLHEVQTEMHSNIPLFELFGGMEAFQQLPPLVLRTQDLVGEPEGAQLCEIIAKRLHEPKIRGKFIFRDGGERPFFGFCLQKQGTDEYQVRVYHQRGVKFFGTNYTVEWYVESINPQVLGRRTYRTECVVSRGQLKNNTDVQELRELINRGHTASGWKIVVPLDHW